jgi:hypothetical protein
MLDSEIAENFVFLLARRCPLQTGDARDFAQRRAPQRHAIGRDQRRQIAARQMQALAEVINSVCGI